MAIAWLSRKPSRSACRAYTVPLRSFSLFLTILLLIPGSLTLVARLQLTQHSSSQEPSNSISHLTASAAAAAAAPQFESPLLGLKGKTGKAGGDDGGDPTPAERLQVVLYRVALMLMALSWISTYILDFFMTTAVPIDPGMQKSTLEFADFCAGFAALVVPTGSFLILGVVLKLVGMSSIACVVLGATGAAKVGSLAGPVCVILTCAREIYWFGLANKIDAASTLLLFLVVLALRSSFVYTGIDLEAGRADTGTNARDITLLRDNELQWLSRWQELELPPYTGSFHLLGLLCLCQALFL